MQKFVINTKDIGVKQNYLNQIIRYEERTVHKLGVIIVRYNLLKFINKLSINLFISNIHN